MAIETKRGTKGGSIKMIRVTLSILLLFTIGCSGKIRPQDMNVALTLSERAYRYELEGNDKMSSFTYIRAIAKFRDMGEFCNMARVALNMYTISDMENKAMLDDTVGFAMLGGCSDIQNIVSFYSNESYNKSLLPSPYRYFADGDYLSVAKSEDYTPQVRSHAYRMAGLKVMDENPKTAIEYANKAIDLDSMRSWTKNLFKDYTIILNASKKGGLPTDIIEEQVNILYQALLERY